MAKSGGAEASAAPWSLDSPPFSLVLIQEQRSVSAAAAQNIDPVRLATLMSIPGADDHRYVAFVSLKDPSLAAQAGNCFVVNSRPEINDREGDWSAVVVEPLPLTRLFISL
ncbi:MAG: hypothetical protein M1819_002311 [Sarea resinae]|nr:MAG: hypothetical protein M1819_002311 [Sarea resinae]